jgi:hypothetical protein
MTRCTCLRDAALRVLVTDPDCPAMYLHATKPEEER